MKLVTSIFFASCAILIQIIDSNIAESEFPASNSTINRALLWNAGRAKRAIYTRCPIQLMLTIEYETDQRIDLILIRRIEILANQYLPVIMHNSGLNPNVMNDIGEFVMYHDVANCAAVVYFRKLNALYGIIGMDYHIHGVPFDFCETGYYRLGVVREPYVSKNRYEFSHINPDRVFPPPFDTDAWEDFLRSSNYIPVYNKRPSTSDAGPSTKRQRTEQEFDGRVDTSRINANANTIGSSSTPIFQKYYLEVLVFVTRDLAELFKTNFGEDYVAAIVRYHIIYFNAVDVIVRKLGNYFAHIHMNIAKIIIEDDSMPFDFISDGETQFTDIVAKLIRYLRLYRNDYTPDSFDHVFIHTSRAIMDDIIPVNALTRYGQDMYEARKHRMPYDAVPITVLRFEYFYAHYVVAAHEIGRTFNIKITPNEKKMESTGQCQNIMQREGPKCSDCLTWSDDNQEQFETFFRNNRNRCFLLNEPRSIRPPGTSRFLTPLRQCQCFGYDSCDLYSSGSPINSVTISGCSEPIKCRKIFGTVSQYESTIWPFDGTECSHKKVCWNGECEKLTLVPFPFNRL